MEYEKIMTEAWEKWHTTPPDLLGDGDYIPAINSSFKLGFITGLNSVQDDVVSWHKVQFPNATDSDVNLKVLEELRELIEAVESGTNEQVANEAADVVITICNKLDRMGLKLSSVVNAKMEINRQRDWSKR